MLMEKLAEWAKNFPKKGIGPTPLGSAPVYFKESIFTADVSR